MVTVTCKRGHIGDDSTGHCLECCKMYQKDYLARMTPNEREQHKAKARAMTRKWAAKRTPEQIEQRKAYMRKWKERRK